MTSLYVDTVYLIALVNPADQIRARAIEMNREARFDRKITSDPVLVELLAWAGARGPHHRRAGLALIDELRSDQNVTIVRQTPELFDAGLEFYRRRPDKGYSLTDCMSMVICGEQEITQVLTHDQHFSQEGFEILL